MVRPGVVGAAIAALLCGFSAAPYTHAHHTIDSVSDERHPHGQTLVHTHATPHFHHDPDEPAPQPADSDAGEQIWSVDGFVFPQPAPGQIPMPVLAVFEEAPVELTSVRLGADRLAPRAHGPPDTAPSSLRAPPVHPPAFS